MLSLINASSPKAFLRNMLSSCFFSSDNDIIGAGPQNEKCTFPFAKMKRKFSEIVSSPLRAFSHLTGGRCISVSVCINVHNVNCNLSTMDVIIIVIVVIIIIQADLFNCTPSLNLLSVGP